MANCRAETQAVLRHWANMVFRVKVGALVPPGYRAVPEALDAFAALEIQCETTTFRRATGNHNGKLYKEGVFLIELHPGREHRDLENYLSTMLRTCAADFVAKNVPLEALAGAVEDSTDKPLGADNESTLGETLMDATDPAMLIALREYRNLAITLAGQIFPRLARPEKVGLAAIYLDLPLSSAPVTAAAGVAKSQLSSRLAMTAKPGHPAKPKFREYLETQVAHLEGPTWNELTPAERKILVEFTYDGLCYAAVAWAKSETDCQFLFQ